MHKICNFVFEYTNPDLTVFLGITENQTTDIVMKLCRHKN